MKKLLPVAFGLLLIGCGYQMVGKETHIPPGLNSIAIPTFVNKTMEPGIEVPFTQALLREFILDRRVKVTDRKDAETILEGVINSFNLFSVAYDRSGYALEYQVIVVADITLKRNTGETLWVEKHMSETRWFRVSQSILMTEDNKVAAIREAGEFMAQRIRNRFFYNF